ncbi:MAG: 30S ribosomal protein S2 [Verrucomicrobia bacterium]|nr:30S ribosomal protein S2 [Verrucomicrobiota bacterium]
MAESFTKTVGVQDLLDAGLHFGHQTKRWNPKMKRYIHGAKNGIYIIDLNKTLSQLELAQTFLNDVILRGEKVLFVGTKKQAREIIKETAEGLEQPYVIHRWLGGMLTNNKTIRSSVSRMRELQKMENDGSMEKLLKKEISVLRREKTKLERNLSGIASMEKKPGALFVIDLNREKLAIAEAQRLNIPIVALVDTNTDPDEVDYPIPGNDDSLRSIGLIAEVLGETIKQAHEIYTAKAKAEKEAREKVEAEEREKAKIAREERQKKEAEDKKKREEVLKKIKEQKKKADAKKKAEADAAKKAEAEKAAKEEVKEEAPAAAKTEEATPVAEEPKAEEAKVEETPAVEASAEKAEEEEAPADEEELKKIAEQKKEADAKKKKAAAAKKKAAAAKKAKAEKEAAAAKEEVTEETPATTEEAPAEETSEEKKEA